MTQTWRECFAELLFSGRSRALDVARRLDDSGAESNCWPLVFQAAANWSVVPQLASAIRSLGRPIAPEGWPEFTRVVLATKARSALRASRGLAAWKYLEDGGIPALVFKGLASMASLYPTPTDRTIGDTDLLVVPEHVPAALARLAEIGFQPAAGQEFDKVEQFLDNAPGFAGNKAIALYGPQKTEIDLHWFVGIAGIPPELMLERSRLAVLFGSDIRVPTAMDAMILTARHTVRDNFTIDTICRDLLDIQLWCDRLARGGALRTILFAIQESGHATPLLAMTRILESYDPHSAASKAVCHLMALTTSEEQRAAGELMNVFFAQVKSGPLSKDILYLAHTKPMRQIFAGLRTNWREYRGVMRSLEERLEGKELPLKRRVQMLAGAASGVSFRQFRSIRTLAHLKYDD